MSRSNRRSISQELFSAMASVLLLGLLLMCVVQTGLSTVYFARERRVALTGILDGATAVTEAIAAEGGFVTDPLEDFDQREDVERSFELFNTASGAVVFVAGPDGQVLLHNGVEAYTGESLPLDLLEKMDDGKDIFSVGTLNGVFTGKYYAVGRRIRYGEHYGYLFAASSMQARTSYVGNMLSMYVMASALMLLVCTVITVVLTRRITRPIQEISEAARQLGNGDFTARAPMEESNAELADLTRTFNQMAGRLQTIDNARGQFMGNIAHELRTPMTSIKGFIDGMLDGTIPPEENPHYLAIVSQETGRLARLVQNMLDITKLEAGEVPVHARCYDVWQTVTDVVLADEQRIVDGKIDIEGLGGPPLQVYADPDLVHQVVYNLVDNAIKFTPAGGVISFEAHKEGELVQISVQNTGPGIAPEALPFVFERFYKEDKSRGMNTRGSGLGLHICKILVQLSGGQIRVESEEGQWCRFVFTLPMNESTCCDKK